MARLNTKMSSYQHRNSHFKDNTVSRPSYLYNGNSHHKDKMVSRSSYLNNGSSHTGKDCLCIETRPFIIWALKLDNLHSHVYQPFSLVIVSLLESSCVVHRILLTFCNHQSWLIVIHMDILDSTLWPTQVGLSHIFSIIVPFRLLPSEI